MSFKRNYIWQFSMLLGVFCQSYVAYGVQDMFLLLSWNTSWVVADATSSPFVGFGDCTIPSFEPFKTMAHPLAQPIGHYTKREKKTHTHTHMSKWCSNFATL
jgi:hypothetical protein